MERFFYERYVRRDDSFMIFDRLRGHVDEAAIAYTKNEDVAEKIVDALNASVRNGG